MSEEKKLVPKLRFPEFQAAAAWIEKSGNSLFDQISDRNPEPGLPVLAITQEHGAIPRHMIDYHVSVTEKSIESYKVVQVGDFIISLRSFQGGIEYSNYQGICSPAYVVLRRRGEGSDAYFKHYLKTDRFIHTLTKNLEGLRDGKMISYKQFSELRLPVPSSSEQQKIADCLSSLDELIAAQARKVDALKTHKKGLMQQLFPREGETQPRLRFPEFQEAGEWEEKCLDELVDIQSGATPSKANPTFWNGSVPWVSAKDMKQFLLEDAEDHISVAAINDGARLVPAGTLLVLTRGMTLLKDVPICVLRREMSFNQDVKGLRPKNGVDGLFLAWILTGSKQRLLAMVNVAGHGTGKLDTDELKALALAVPSLAEQQRIADCLTSLDSLITSTTQELETLKTHKKGLMQQLFPLAEAVAA
ncbi:MAG: restriction endonuclease subunit S [Burkholderiaceae bacterium]|nr:restriction endonuclease subunit S [Burkholderiaceae bacterium]